MSLLRQESEQELDDAAKGESFTRGTSHIVWASIVAAILVTVALAAYVVGGEKPPAATGEILEVWTHSMHVETPSFDANGTSIPKDTYNQVLVFTHARLHNQSKNPIFLHEILTNTTLADGIHTSSAAPGKSYERLFLAYPDLKQWQSTPLAYDTTLNPGQTVEGTFVSSFRLTKDEWDAHKDISYTFAFRYLPALKVKYTGPITVR